MSEPIGYWNFMVAGVRYEDRPRSISRYVEVDDPAFLKRDKANKHSKNAIEVYTDNEAMVGYVPEDHAPEIAPLLDKGCRYKAIFTRVLTEGRSPIPIVDVYIYDADANVEGAISLEETFASPDGFGCWTYIVIGAVILFTISYCVG